MQFGYFTLRVNRQKISGISIRYQNNPAANNRVRSTRRPPPHLGGMTDEEAAAVAKHLRQAMPVTSWRCGSTR